MKKSNMITICSTSYHEYDRRLIRIAKALNEAGYEVTWISRSLKKNTVSSDQIKHKVINTIFKRGPAFYLEYNIRLFWVLVFSSKSIINSIDLDTVPACVLAGLLKRNTVVHDAHEIFYEVPELTGKRIKRQLWKTIAKIFLPRIKTNYTVNQSLAKHYEKHYKIEYKIIRNLPFPKAGGAPKTNNKTIVYLGVLNHGRGIELAIEAMRLMPEYNLLLVGEGDNSEKLREQAEGLENVTFCGYVEPHNIQSYLDQASIGLNMLVAHSLNYKLSLANKFFDYMHAGLPSINMAYPEYLHILESHEVGIAVPEYATATLCSALARLDDPDFFSKLSSNCHKFKSHYSWTNEKIKLVEIYNNLHNTST